MLTDTDVSPVETTTPESSTENETTTTTVADEAVVAEAAKDDRPEQNYWAEKARKAEKELEALRRERESQQTPADPNEEVVKAQLKKMGFVSQAEIEAELARRDQDARIDRELSTLETKYSGTDGRPKFDREKVLQYAVNNDIGNAEVAYKAMFEKQLTDWAIQQAVTKTKGVKSEGSDGSGSTQVGTTNEDLKDAIRKGDPSALKTFIRRVTSPEG